MPPPLTTFPHQLQWQRFERSHTPDELQSSSPQTFYDAVSNNPASSPAEVGETSFEEEEDKSDSNLKALRRRALPPLAVIAPKGSDSEDVLFTGQGLSSQHAPAIGRASLAVEIDTSMLSTLELPRSRYAGYVPPLPISREREAIPKLRHAMALEDVETSDAEGYTEFELTEFAMYLPGTSSKHPFELRGLQDFASKSGHSNMLFDGILSVGLERQYVEGVPFGTCSIGNYGKEHHTVGDDIWIKSTYNKGSDVFYRLKSPAPEYRRFHCDFLWIADLAKHFVDFLEACTEERELVYIHNFRHQFSYWAHSKHGNSADFQKWWRKYRDHDFRRAVVCNINFLFKESAGVSEELREHPLWSQTMEKNFLPMQKLQQAQTIVTPYVYECFKHLRFGHHLKSVTPTKDARNQQANQGKALHLTPRVAIASDQPVVHLQEPDKAKFGIRPQKSATRIAVEIPAFQDPFIKRREWIKAIRPGDVLAVTKDKEGSSNWKDEVSAWKAADNCWYVYVQSVHISKSGSRSFEIIWLYKPSDTSCAKMKYPFPNELFLSDNCNCVEGRMDEDRVMDGVDVVWYGKPTNSSRDFFIRQTYLENDRFVTLRESHKKCEHLTDSVGQTDLRKEQKYPVGSTVLVSPKSVIPRGYSKHGLEPFEVVRYETFEAKDSAILRRLLRRKDIAEHGSSSPNELLYTDELVRVCPREIERTCLVRFYSDVDVARKAIPAPYSRRGTGNAFFITSKVIGDNGPEKITGMTSQDAPSLIQGFDPQKVPSRDKLRGLDLYCGGGNFGRGLEEGGAMFNEWATDVDKTAIHTYLANLHDPDATALFYGSVNDQLFQAMEGNPNQSKLIPQPGDVDFISAGSPCQGYTILNKDRNNESGTRNQSLVASVAAYIDFYRPKYGLLENVLNMAQRGLGRDEDVLSQLICTIVGMGYQLSTFMLDAWSCGSSQSRSRIFVAFTAPGCVPMCHPELSHSHPPWTRNFGLGQLANGQSFGERKEGLTPFNFVKASEAVADLPIIGDGRTYSCIPHPDHVLAVTSNKEISLQMQAIPMFPRGMTFWDAWKDGAGVMSSDQRALFPPAINGSGVPRLRVMKGSKAWGRVNPDRLFPTVVSTAKAADSRMGRTFHWDQQRILTVLEAKRAQGFLDNEVILGPTSAQMKIIGNSVDRSVSLALGLCLREAWEQNSIDERTGALTHVVKDASIQAAKYHLTSLDRPPGSQARSDAPGSGVPVAPATRVLSPENKLTANKTSYKSTSIISTTSNPTPPNQSHRLITDTKKVFNNDLYIPHSQNALAIKSFLSRKTNNHATTSMSLNSHSASKYTSSKRTLPPTVSHSEPPAQSRKAAKISGSASPTFPAAQEMNSLAVVVNNTVPLQQACNLPLRATPLNQKLHAVLARGVSDKEDSFGTADDDFDITDFEGFSSSDVEDELSQYNVVLQAKVPLQRQEQTSASQNTTRAIYVDLTLTDDEMEKLPLRPSPSLPVGNAVQRSMPSPAPKKYIPVDNSQFAAYAQTYAMCNYEQGRRHVLRTK